MSLNEFVTWLEQHINDPDIEGDMDYLIWLVNKKLATVERGEFPFCGGRWDAMKFDYYWTPGHVDE